MGNKGEEIGAGLSWEEVKEHSRELEAENAKFEVHSEDDDLQFEVMRELSRGEF